MLSLCEVLSWTLIGVFGLFFLGLFASIQGKFITEQRMRSLKLYAVECISWWKPQSDQIGNSLCLGSGLKFEKLHLRSLSVFVSSF